MHPGHLTLWEIEFLRLESKDDTVCPTQKVAVDWTVPLKSLRGSPVPVWLHLEVEWGWRGHRLGPRPWDCCPHRSRKRGTPEPSLHVLRGKPAEGTVFQTKRGHLTICMVLRGQPGPTKTASGENYGKPASVTETSGCQVSSWKTSSFCSSKLPRWSL